MAQVSVAECAFHLTAQNAHAEIIFFADIFRSDGFPEAGPAGAGLEFGFGIEKGGAAIRAAKKSGTVFIHKFAGVGNLGAGLPTLLDPYAATAPAEFFAVVTEVFFGQPRELEALHPLLYEQLRSYYRLDPARWEIPAPTEVAGALA